MMPRAAVAPHRLGMRARRTTTRRTAPTSSARTTRGRTTTRRCGSSSGRRASTASSTSRSCGRCVARSATTASRSWTSTPPSTRASRRGRARAPSWASSSTTTTCRASRRWRRATTTATRGRRRRSRRIPTVYARTQLALGALFTLPGAPILYYGDEVGARRASRDPDSRRVMPAESRSQRRCRRRRATSSGALGQARACSAALRRGTYRTLHVDPERLVFARELPGADTAIVDLQRSPTASLSAPLPGISAGSWVDVLSGRVSHSALS